MKNITIFIVLALFLASCASVKYSSLDSQFAVDANRSIAVKYNCKNLKKVDKRKKDAVRQLAIVTHEE